jgi:hypothetical protein
MEIPMTADEYISKYSGTPEFNWLACLELCVATPPTTHHHTLQQMSAHWPSCACGELCQSLPRFATGEPADATLKQLGLDFSAVIYNQHWDLALEVFKKIERRTTQLLEWPLEEKV